MSRLGLTLLALCAVGGCSKPRTETVVIISTSGIRVPEDIDGLRIHIVDKSGAVNDDLYDVTHPLCRPGLSENCLNLPITMTLFPGSMRPHDSVRVQIDALAGSTPKISNAALFTFSEGQSLRLDFVLYANCLGRVDCSVIDQVCGPDDRCSMITPMPFAGEPDLSSVADLASRFDAAGLDLAPSFRDMASLVDLKNADLAGCAPQCSGRACGDDQCLGSCGDCTGFSYCETFSGSCQPCGADGQFCCANSTCKFTLICDGTNHCQMPMVGMEPPCGGQTQICCPGDQCDPGLTCDGTLHCFPVFDMMEPPPFDLSEPPPDMTVDDMDMMDMDSSQGPTDFGTTTIDDSGKMMSIACGDPGELCCPVPQFPSECVSPLGCVGGTCQ